MDAGFRRYDKKDMTDTYENSFAQYEQQVKKTIESILRRILLKIHADADRIIRDNKAIASGEMVKNLREQVYEEAGKLIGVVGVGANVPYGIYRHEGTKPHFPPIAAIQKWVIQKGIIRDDHGIPLTTRRSTTQGYDARARAIAFLIARKIAKRGTQGLRFLEMALNQNQGYIINEFKTALG